MIGVFFSPPVDHFSLMAPTITELSITHFKEEQTSNLEFSVCEEEVSEYEYSASVNTYKRAPQSSCLFIESF